MMLVIMLNNVKCARLSAFHDYAYPLYFLIQLQSKRKRYRACLSYFFAFEQLRRNMCSKKEKVESRD